MFDMMWFPFSLKVECLEFFYVAVKVSGLLDYRRRWSLSAFSFWNLPISMFKVWVFYVYFANLEQDCSLIGFVPRGFIFFGTASETLNSTYFSAVILGVGAALEGKCWTSTGVFSKWTLSPWLCWVCFLLLILMLHFSGFLKLNFFWSFWPSNLGSNIVFI